RRNAPAASRREVQPRRIAEHCRRTLARGAPPQGRRSVPLRTHSARWRPPRVAPAPRPSRTTVTAPASRSNCAATVQSPSPPGASARARPSIARHDTVLSSRRGGGRVDATGGWLGGAKSEHSLRRPIFLLLPRNALELRGGNAVARLAAETLVGRPDSRIRDP